jgi:hypothetical protein
MIATNDLVNTETGELKEIYFLDYKFFCYKWRETVLRFLVRRKIITKKESAWLRKIYKYGFHVYFKKISGSNNDILFSCAEYLASGFFHNSKIKEVDFKKNEISFTFKSQVERRTGEKKFKTIKMSVFEFMAKMLYFLPDKNEKQVRYYGLYVRPSKNLKEILKKNKASWATAIEYCFNKNPKLCPRCKTEMEEHTVKSFQKYWILKDLKDNYTLKDGYFYPESFIISQDFKRLNEPNPTRGP